jgi:hypothetical protein
MRVLVAVLLVGVVGCGVASSPSAQTADADTVAALKRLGGRWIKRNEQGEVVHVSFPGSPHLTDAGLVHLRGLTKLKPLHLWLTVPTQARTRYTMVRQRASRT